MTKKAPHEVSVTISPIEHDKSGKKSKKYDLQRLCSAFESGLWKWDEEIPEDCSYINEIELIKWARESWLFHDMNLFYQKLQEAIMLNITFQALREHDIQKVASVFSEYPFVEFSKEARDQFKECIINLLNLKQINSMVPILEQKVLSFRTSDDLLHIITFTKDENTIKDDSFAVLAQANEFREKLYQILFLLSNIPNLEIVWVYINSDHASILDNVPEDEREDLAKSLGIADKPTIN